MNGQGDEHLAVGDAVEQRRIVQRAVPRSLHPVEGPGVPAVGDAVVVRRVDVVGGQHVEGEAVGIGNYLVLVRSDVTLVYFDCVFFN